MNSVLYPLCAAVAWLALIYKFPALRVRPRDHAVHALAAAFAFLGLSFTISTPVVWAWIDALTGVTNLSTLLSQGFVIAFVAAEQVLLVLWAFPPHRAWPKARRRLTWVGVVLAAMVALFLAADTTEERTTDFVVHYAGQPYYATYLLVYVTAFTAGQLEVSVLCLRYARAVGTPWLRRGLLIAGSGAVLGLFYCAARYADVALTPLGLDPARWEFVARLGAGLGALLNLVGWTLPGWGPALGWIGRLRSYRRLHPLWSALYAASPQIALDPPGSRFTLADSGFRLYRRVIEIRDGRLALHQHMDPAVAEVAARHGAAAGLSGDQLRAAVEAAQLAVALRAKTSGAAPVVTGEVDYPGGEDLAGEIAWLIRVSTAFAGSPVVQATLAEL
ncbi:hypothetical protein BC739_008231 [Kutzneria viridogrisea]|uniref:DUF6545 domain-containing protein n=1 Tax=Kutzneria viridogrisea TaxID=47990 RepID=A0ABR6BWN2_9PSEU|nr:hypothetical protein [Kutzneria viridogrisea]